MSLSTDAAGAKQRRGKKETKEESKTALDDQLARAIAAVQHSEQQTNALHKQWRTYLLRLSYLLVLVSMHQMQDPTGACLKDIKSFNSLTASEEQISGSQAFVLVIADVLPYILAVVMSAALSFFLILEEPANFSHPRYLFANALLPPMVGIHFMYKNKVSCLNDEQLETIEPQPRTRGIPVIVIFHVIVTVCYWFMSNQRQQQARNLSTVHDLQRDLNRARQGATTSTKTSGSGTKKSK